MSKFIMLHRQDTGKEVMINVDLIRIVLPENIPSRKKGEPAKNVTNVTTMGGAFYAAESYEEVKKILMGDENNG